jgi:hypothetical protein
MFNGLWNQTRSAFGQQRTHERARRLAMSALLCLGRHTFTGLITASGCQSVDWSADYRLFERERFDPEGLFQVSRDTVEQQLPSGTPLVVAMDDTLLRKRGRKVAGTSWRRDPLGPAFHNNFVWGQRFLQVSAMLPEQAGTCRARAIPVDLQHCPSPRKPYRNASEEEWDQYKQAANDSNIAQRGVERLQALRQSMDQTPWGKDRRLIATVDGSFTNSTVLKSLPLRTTLIGRIRKDAKLYALPDQDVHGRGRKRCYGKRVSTPEELRQDESIPWQSVSVYAAGKSHQCKYKTLSPLRWRNAGGDHNLRLVVIAPLAYRLSQHSRLLYRKPVYLVCTDPDLPIEQFIQYYVWRWGIEVNFRDEKTLLGMEQPQVRTPQAVASIPAFFTAAYALLLLASSQVEDLPHSVQSLVPKWRTLHDGFRPSTGQILSFFRKQLWGLAIQQSNFSGFVNLSHPNTTRQKLKYSLQNAVFYAHG